MCRMTFVDVKHFTISENNSSRFSGNSEANASEFLENLEVFPLYHTLNNICQGFKSLTTH